MPFPSLRPEVLVCPLCGGTMHDSTGGCTTCALHSGCAMLCCNRCGYTTVAPRSKTVDFFKRLFGRKATQGDPGQRAASEPATMGKHG